MSSLLCVISKTTEGIEEDLIKTFETLFERKLISSRIVLFDSGFEGNFYRGKNKKFNWIVNGFGLKKLHQNYTILQNFDWEAEIKNDFENDINGHFIVLKWNKDNFYVFTDLLGLRDIYFAETERYFVLSTKTECISNFKQTEINFDEFSSRWLLFNQISTKSIFKNVVRLSQGDKLEVKFKTNKFQIVKKNWMPKVSESYLTERDYFDLLNESLNVKLHENERLTLGLSGGMDSRVLLSFLLKSKINWNSHTIGKADNPDNIIAKNIAKAFPIEHQNYFSEEISPVNIIDNLECFAIQTLVTNPVTIFPHLQNLSFIKPKEIVVDGGFGEIWRREFFFKVLSKGKRNIKRSLLETVFSNSLHFKADIFNYEINQKMTISTKEQINNLIKQLPNWEKIRIENWLDLFAIKTRIPNFYGTEQFRIDNLFQNYMPFLDLELISNLFKIPIELRKNGKLFREIIKQNEAKLTKYPLAKGNYTHPYFLNSLQSRLWIMAKKRFYKSQNNQENNILWQIKEYVYDTLLSKAVKESEIYDYFKIKNLVENFYNKKVGTESQIGWWLSFEIIRRKIQAK